MTVTEYALPTTSAPAPAAAASLSLRGVGKRFGTVTALDDVDLHVDAHTLTAVLGPSGCGKTTLLRVIAGFVAPDAGTVTVGGRLLNAPGLQVPPERRGIAVVPQEGALFPHLSVADNVGYGLPRRSGRRRRRIGEMLELVGLEGLGARRPDELSGGQQQRVALARALAPSPAVVVLDEPFSALDAGLRAHLRADVRQALRASGATGLIVTHDQVEALSMADSVAVMSRGRVCMHAGPEDVYRHPCDLGVARFVGDLVELPAVKAGTRLTCALGVLGTASELPDGPVLACLRPEQLRAAHPDPALPAGVVEDLLFQGPEAMAQIRVRQLDGSGTVVRARVRSHLDVGAEVSLQVDGPALVFPSL